MLTELEAWERIAHLFANNLQIYNLDVYINIGNSISYGICDVISDLQSLDHIDFTTAIVMRTRFRDYRGSYNLNMRGYCWPQTHEGAAERVEVCKLMADQVRNEPIPDIPYN